MAISSKEKLIFFSSILVKLGFFFLILSTVGYLGFVDGDASTYLTLANNIFHYGVFSLSHQPPFLPETSSTPGYPFLLGITSLPFNSVIPTALIQIIVGSLAAVFLYRLLRSIFSDSVSFFSALIFAVEPWNSFVVNLALAEAFFLFFFIFGLYLVKRAIDNRPTILNIGGAGLAIGLATMLRPILLYLAPFVALIFLVSRGRLNFKKSAAFALLFLAAAYLLIVPWQLRNYKIFNSFSFSTKGVFTLYLFDIEQLLVFRDHIPAREADQKLVTIVRAGRPEIKTVDDLTVALENPANASFFYKKSFETIRQSPLLYLKLRLASAAVFFFSDGYRLIGQQLRLISQPVPNITLAVFEGRFKDIFSYFRSNYSLVFIFVGGLMFWSLITLLAVLALPFAYFSESDKKIFWASVVFWCAIGYFVLLTGLVSQARYRIPATPFLFSLAVYSLSKIFALIGGIKKRPEITVW
jgi:4-amino-4-deoxy-L-arabinose transferase-like glycosyltransferase